jgi:hypothetical protein
MGLVEQFCHRALMISGGHITQIGDPADVARAYLSENFRTVGSDVQRSETNEEVRLVEAWMTDAEGQRLDAVAYGPPMHLHVAFEVLTRVSAPGISMWVSNEEGVRVFSAGAREDHGPLADLEPGERIEFSI